MILGSNMKYMKHDSFYVNVIKTLKFKKLQEYWRNDFRQLNYLTKVYYSIIILINIHIFKSHAKKKKLSTQNT